MAQQLTFSRSIYFTGLTGPGIQPATLVWEIENDPTLSAALIDVRFGEIQVAPVADNGQGAAQDEAATLELRRNGNPIDWADVVQAERDALFAVFAAHEGVPTRADEQSARSTSTTTATTWTTKLSITTEPLAAGKYVWVATCEHCLQSAPGTLGTTRASIRVEIDENDGAGPVVRGRDDWMFEHNHAAYLTGSFTAREGGTVTVNLQHQGTGTGAVSEIKRARLSVKPIDGTEDGS